MAPDEGNIHAGGDRDEALEERRQSRLWLGYSADNLRNPQNVTRSLSQTENEGLTPHATAALGVTHNDHQDTLRDNPDIETAQSQVQKKPTLKSKAPVTNHLGDNVEEPSLRPSRSNRLYNDSQVYNLPANYENLVEIVAPPPFGVPGEAREQDLLEDCNNKPSRYEDVVLGDVKNPNEAGSFPVGDIKRDDTNGDLENRNPGGLAKGSKSHGKDSATRRPRVSKLANELYTVSYLILFSILGTLARLGLQALTFYPGAPVQTGLLWCNVGGSLVMGFLSEDRKLFRGVSGIGIEEKIKGDDDEDGISHPVSTSADDRHAAVKKTLPLYIGLATGFCGSFTSFSSFMRDAFFALSNALPVPRNHLSSASMYSTVNLPRNPGYSFFAVLAVLIMTIGLSLMALMFGAHLALILEPLTPAIPYLFARNIVHRFIVFLAFGCWLAAILMAIWPPDRPGGPVGNGFWMEETWRSQALFALVFAPPGCLLRFYISLHLNGKIKAFPLGTFAVNIFGTITEAVFLDLQRVPVGGMIGCQVLQGMSDGFCGCLTTVSTWVAELTALRTKHAYFYGMMSVSIALSFLVIITGSLQWTKGFSPLLCTS